MTDKFCKDCRHYNRTEVACERTFGVEKSGDLVVGYRTAWRGLNPFAERSGFTTLFGLFGCGPSGKYWEGR